MVNRAELPPLKTWLATWQSFVGTRSTRPSGYARLSRFVKEFGPDQVLRSDRFEIPFSASESLKTPHATELMAPGYPRDSLICE